MPTATATGNPFPGLRPFEPEQSDLFFGRDEEIEGLIAKLRARRFVGVVGVSGSGKSSLVRAGLIPRLRDGFMIGAGRRWRIMAMKPGNDPFAELGKSLEGCFGLPGGQALAVLQASSRGLAALCAAHAEREDNVLLLVDQFEELIRFRSAPQQWEAARAFVELLLAATGYGLGERGRDERPAIYVVITMRSEYLGKCAQFAGLPEVLNEGQFLVPRMGRAQVRMAIEGPVRMAGGRITADLVQRLLNEASDETDQLPLLQHALMLMWDQSGGNMNLDHYKLVGGSIGAALNGAADRARFRIDLESVLPDSDRILRRTFQRLAEPGLGEEELRRPTRLSELVKVTGAEEKQLLSLLTPLRDRGFVVLSADEDPMVDVTHESLIRQWKTLNEWVKEEARNARLYLRLAGTAAQGGAKYRGRDLEDALRWQAAEQPNAEWAARYPVEDGSFSQAIGFLDRSRKARRRRIALGASVAGLVVLLAVLATVGWVRSSSLLERGVAQRLAAEAQTLASGPSRLAQVSLLLAIESLKRQPSGDADAAVRAISNQIPVFVSKMKHDGTVTSLQFSDDPSGLVSGSDDKTARLWNVESGRELARLGLARQVREVRLDPAGDYLLTVEGDVTRERATRGPGAVRIWKMNKDKGPTPLIGTDFPGPVSAWAFAGTRVVATDGATLRTVPLSPGSSVREEGAPKAQRLALSPDGKYLLAVNDQLVQVRDLETGDTEQTMLPGNEIQGSSLPEIRFSHDGRSFHTLDQFEVLSRKGLPALRHWSLHPLAQVGPAVSIDFSRFFAISDNDELIAHLAFGGVEVFDMTSLPLKIVGQAERGPEGFEPGVFSPILQFSGDSRQLAWTPGGAALRVSTIRPWKEISHVGLDRTLTSLAWSRDGSLVAIGTEDGSITTWRLASTAEAWSVDGLQFSYSPRSGYSVVTGLDGHTTVIDRRQRQILDVPVEPYVFSSDDRFFSSIAKNGTTVTLYELPAGHALPPFLATKGSRVVAAGFSPPDSMWVVTSDGQLTEWRVTGGQTGQKLNVGPFEPGQTGYVVFSPRAEICAVARMENRGVTLWQTKLGRRLWDLPIVPSRGVLFSPDASLLAGVSQQGTRYLAVWSTESGKKLWQEGLRDLNATFAFDSKSARLAVGMNHELKVWGARSGKAVLRIDDETAAVRAVEFDPSGDYLASLWTNGRIKIWRLADGVQVNDIRPPAGTQYSGLGLLFSPDGSHVIAGVADDRGFSFRAYWWRPADVIREACKHVAFNLSPDEWRREVNDGAPAETCPMAP